MSVLTIIKFVFYEIFFISRVNRVPEPESVMDNEENSLLFDEEGRPSGMMAPLYLFINGHISDIVQSQDYVLDLGSGSGQLITQIAETNPSVQFMGTDLSNEMLKIATERINKRNIANLNFKVQDMTQLSEVADQSVDAVTSSLSFHHLPNEELLEACFKNIARVMKKDASLFLLDFNFLNSNKTIECMVKELTESKKPFIDDYFNSLNAAFPKSVIKKYVDQFLPTDTFLYSPLLAPFITIVYRNPTGGSNLTSDKKKLIYNLFRKLSFKNKLNFILLNYACFLKGMRTVIKF